MGKIIHMAILIMLLAGTLSMTVAAQSEQMLLGYLHKEDFDQEPHSNWFNENYKAYEIEKHILNDIDVQQQNLTFMVFLGSWCGDTKRELPRFLKIMDYLRIPAERITLMGLDRNKRAPVYTDNNWKIQYVPTFIVLKNGFEIGRIIEQPVLTLEEDLKNMIGLKFIPKPGSVLLKNIKKADQLPLFGDCEETGSITDRSACSDKQLEQFFKSNHATVVKNNDRKGKVMVSFIIDIDGKVKDVRAGNSKVSQFQTEVVGIVNKMNENQAGWKPAIKNGQTVAVRHKLLIGFDEK